MYRWFWSFLRPDAGKILVAFSLALVASALAMVNPSLMGFVVDHIIIGGDTALLPRLLALLLGATILRMGIRWVFVMIFEYSSQRMVKALRESLFHRLMGLDHGYFDRTRTGDIMALMTGDLDACRHMVSWVGYQVFEGLLVLGFSLVVLFSTHAGLTALLFLAFPFIGVFTWFLATGVKPHYGRVRDKFSALNSVVQENIAGNRVVRAFVREDEEMRKFTEANDEYRTASIDASKVWGTYIPLIDFAAGFIVVIMLLGGGWFILQGEMTIGALVVFNGLVWALSNPLRMAGWLINDIQRFAASLERLFALSRVEASIKDLALSPAPCSPTPAPVDAAPQASTPGEPTVRGRLAFDRVTFAYGDEPVLQDISFSAEPGQTIGVVGPTGSGKSSLVRLLARYYEPATGTITLDDRPLKDWPLATLRSEVGFAMQDVFLFSDTLEGNISFGRPQAAQADIHHAAAQARADEFIAHLPEGYHTVVGERGIGLSGGQRQRIALARLLLADPAVMVLDDTTSAVDLETEHHLQETMRQLHGSRTLFIVAHRTRTLEHADLILVLDQGRIVQRGTHQDLIVQPGWYRTVHCHQNGIEE